jgi:hypothetical protein
MVEAPAESQCSRLAGADDELRGANNRFRYSATPELLQLLSSVFKESSAQWPFESSRCELEFWAQDHIRTASPW